MHVLRPHQSLSTRRRAACCALSCAEVSVGIKGKKSVCVCVGGGSSRVPQVDIDWVTDWQPLCVFFVQVHVQYVCARFPRIIGHADSNSRVSSLCFYPHFLYTSPRVWSWWHLDRLKCCMLQSLVGHCGEPHHESIGNMVPLRHKHRLMLTWSRLRTMGRFRRGRNACICYVFLSFCGFFSFNSSKLQTLLLCFTFSAPI